MPKISKYFSRHEISCRCGCGWDTMDAETLMISDAVREFYGKPIIPNSGARCLKHNRAIGSNDTSQHVKARAMDLPVDDPNKVYLWLCHNFPGRYGFGCYDTFVHVDSREVMARWRG